MAVVTELVTKFVFQGDTTKLANFNKGMGKSILLLGSFAAAAAASAVVFTKWTNNILSSLNPIIQLSKQIGISVQTIQELGFAAIMSGSSLSAMEGTLSSLTNKIGKSALSGDADFSRLGISVRKATGEIKTADEVLGEISTRFRELNFSLAQQRSMASSLGIDPSLIELLGKTSNELKDLQDQSKGFGILTAQQVSQVESYNKSIQRLSFGFDGMKNLIAIGLAPELENLANGFNTFLSENGNEIIFWAKTTIETLAMVGSAIKKTALLLTGIVLAPVFVAEDLTMPLIGGKSEIAERVSSLIKSPNFVGGKIGEFFGRGGESSSVTQNNSIQINTNIEDVGEVIANSVQYQLEDAQTQAVGSGGGM